MQQQTRNGILRSIISFEIIMPALLSQYWARFWIQRYPVVYLQKWLAKNSNKSQLASVLGSKDNQVLRSAYLQWTSQPNQSNAEIFIEELISILRIEWRKTGQYPNKDQYAAMLDSVRTLNRIIETMPGLQGEVIGRIANQKIYLPATATHHMLGTYLDILGNLGIVMDRKKMKNRQRQQHNQLGRAA